MTHNPVPKGYKTINDVIAESARQPAIDTPVRKQQEIED